MPKVPLDKAIPDLPGVYQFKDKEGQIIYIGKAKNLKKRVASYFVKNPESAKTAALVKKISDIDFIVTDSEFEAIMLESNLIKKHYPKFNVLLKDSSPQSYALITDEDFPRVMIVRKDRKGKIRGPKGRAYGPIMKGSGKGLIINVLRKAFRIRTCGSPMPKRLCLQYHMGNCDGPCEMRISERDYNRNIKKVEDLLKNSENIERYVHKIEQDMKTAAKKKDFEKAIKLRSAYYALGSLSNRLKVDDVKDRDEDYIAIWEEKGYARVQIWKKIHGVIRDREKYGFEFTQEDPLDVFMRRYYENNQIPKTIVVNRLPEDSEALEEHLVRLREGAVHIEKSPSRGTKKELIGLIEKNILMEKAGNADPALIRLQKELRLPKVPIVIECFDISNLGDTYVVGSMVQFVNAMPRKNSYRKFKIRSVLGQDDFGSIKEVVFRRYRRLIDEGQPMPDLVLIDGGLGQLHAAKEALEQLELDLPLFSLAKKEELVFGVDLLVPIKMAKNNEALHVLQRARDEAHRFAINYNRKLRRKKD